MSFPEAVLISLFPALLFVWAVSSVIGNMRRNAEANERIATALEEANTLAGTRGAGDS